MSSEAVRAVARLAASTKAQERTLLMVLANAADSIGVVSKSQSDLADACGWATLDYVRVVANALIERGLVERLTSGHRGMPATYRLTFVPRDTR
jgi:hypothetical protein